MCWFNFIISGFISGKLNILILISRICFYFGNIVRLQWDREGSIIEGKSGEIVSGYPDQAI